MNLLGRLSGKEITRAKCKINSDYANALGFSRSEASREAWSKHMVEYRKIHKWTNPGKKKKIKEPEKEPEKETVTEPEETNGKTKETSDGTNNNESIGTKPNE